VQVTRAFFVSLDPLQRNDTLDALTETGEQALDELGWPSLDRASAEPIRTDDVVHTAEAVQLLSVPSASDGAQAVGRLQRDAGLDWISVDHARSTIETATQALQAVMRHKKRDPLIAEAAMEELGQKGLLLEQLRHRALFSDTAQLLDQAAALYFIARRPALPERASAASPVSIEIVRPAFAQALEREALKQSLFSPGGLTQQEQQVAIYIDGNALVNAKGTVSDLARAPALLRNPGYARLSEADRVALVEQWLHEHGLDSQYPFGSAQNAMATVLKASALARGEPAAGCYASEADLHRAFLALVHDWRHAEGSLVDPRVLFGLNLAKTKGIAFAGNTPQERLADLRGFVNDVLTDPGPDNHALMAQARVQLREAHAPLTEAAVNAKVGELSRAYVTSTASDAETAEPDSNVQDSGIRHWFENAPVLSNVIGFVEGVATGRVEQIINAVPVLSNLYNIEEGVRTGDIERAGMAAITLVPFAGSVATIAEGAIKGDYAEMAGGAVGFGLDFVTLGEGHLLKSGLGRLSGLTLDGSAKAKARAMPTPMIPSALRLHAEHALTALKDLGFAGDDWGLKIVRAEKVGPDFPPVRAVSVLPSADIARLAKHLDGYEVRAWPAIMRRGESGMLWDPATAAHYAHWQGKLYRVAPDRAKTTPQRPLWNIVSPDGSNRIMTASFEYAFDAHARVGQWQLARDLPSVKGGAPGSNAPSRPNFFDGFAAVQASRRARLEQLRISAHGSTHFHGSRSGSLIAFHSSTAAEIRGSLLPMGALLEHGAPVYTGERGNAFHERAFNREHLSVVWEAQFDGALRYATDASFASRSPIKSRASIELPGYESFDANLKQVREVSDARLNEIGDDVTIAAFVRANFPVVYGLKPRFDKLVDVSSDIAGETGVKGGVDPTEIAVIFVPDDHVAAVTAYLEECGYPKPVEPLSSVS
jgi:hypothetical protein